MTSSPGSRPDLEEIITEGVHLDGMSEPVGSSGITGGDDAIQYDDLASYLSNGDWNKAKRFLESNPDGVRRKITLQGYTALHIAISRRHEHIAKELMQLMQEEDFLLRDVTGQTVLHLAAGSGFVGHENFETLMRMMSQEALGIQDEFGCTALHVILKNSKPGFEPRETLLKARQLIDKMREQDLELRDVDDFTALHHAVDVRAVTILRMLMEKMPQQALGIQDGSGRTALHHAVQNRAVQISRMLMEKMPQQVLGIQDMDDNTPLHVAVYSGSVEIVEYLVPLVKVEDLGIQNADGRTALHMASIYGQVNMVEILVKSMKEQDLEKEEYGGRTALSFAVVIGNIDMVKCMVEKNRNLLRIKFEERIPVVSASATQHREMMKYLYTATPSEELRGIQGAMLLNTFILCEMFDIALDLVERYPLQATALHLESQPLLVLAGMPSAFRSGSRLSFWQRWIYTLFVLLEDYSNSQIVHALHVVLKRIFKNIYHRKKINKQALGLQAVICREIQTLKSRDNETRKKLFLEALVEATKNGIYEIAHQIICSDPRLFFETETHSRRMIDLAILHRQEKIFNLIHGLHETSWAFFLNHGDGVKNTMLHVAGTSPSNQLTRISGAALRMQRELQWFKEVERILDPLDRNAKNKDKKTAHELFTENHVKLVEDGETWMKAMASSCTVVAALIVTIMFAAAFTVPGGNNQDSGAPIFLQKKLFLAFIICDAISFFTSSASVLMFVVILTTRYSEEYFLEYLPRMMIIGLSSFFISIITMTVAFCAALFLMLRGQPIWVFVVIILFACVPVFLFLLLLFPLLLDMLTSTYGSSIFKKKKNLSTLSRFKMGVKHVTLQKSSTFKHAIEVFVLLEDYSNSQIVHALHVVLKRKFKYIYHRKIINKQALKLQAVICREIQKQMSRDNEMRKKLFHEALIEATKNGIYEIAHKIIYSDPRLFFETDTHSRRMIDLAILHRQENIFNLIHGLHETSWAFFLNHRDGDKNTMLHVAGMVPSNQLTHISGAALRMQRELQWFKEVESILDPLDINAKNSKGETAHELFTKKHEKLVEDGEKWMKAMASSCTVVAALIVTIMFAAAFTVPGGNNQDSGAPIFLQKKLFLTFIICDAISFFTSSSSTNVPSNPHYALFGRVFPRLLTHDDDDWP